MDSLLLYALVKLAAYTIYCFVGLAFTNPHRPLAARALGYGLLRTLIGAVLGTFIYLGNMELRADLASYLMLYVPVRFLEWGVIALMMFDTSGPKSSWRQIVIWIVVGIGVSFLADLASPQWMYDGSFPSGRALC